MTYIINTKNGTIKYRPKHSRNYRSDKISKYEQRLLLVLSNKVNNTRKELIEFVYKRKINSTTMQKIYFWKLRTLMKGLKNKLVLHIRTNQKGYVIEDNILIDK